MWFLLEILEEGKLIPRLLSLTLYDNLLRVFFILINNSHFSRFLTEPQLQSTMEQSPVILQSIIDGKLTDPFKCALCLAVYREFCESDACEDVFIDFDVESDEIYITARRDGHHSIYLPISYHQDVDLSKIKQIRNKLIRETDSPAK